MAYTTNPYCTLTDVKNILKLPSTDTNDDAFLTSLIAEAQDVVDDWLGKTFQTTTGLQNFDGYGQEKLLVGDCTNITQVLEVSYANFIGSTGTEQVVSATLDITNDIIPGPYDRAMKGLPYIWIKRKSGLEFMNGAQNYQVTATWGNPTIPLWCTRVTARLVAHWYEMRRTNYADTVSTKDGVRTKYGKQMPPDVCELLEYHRRQPWGSR